MDRYDEDTERYLREFRLRAIPPLAFAPKAGNIFLRRLAVAAAVTVFAAATIWLAHRETTRRIETAKPQFAMTNDTGGQRYVTTVELTRLALNDNEELNAILAEESRRALPSFQGKQSTLKVLAGD
jgi:ferric-dicitrate binding protein FerR (iron transport regulator)